MEKRKYLLKIRLIDSNPEIWRQVTVPADITLDRLHDVIQIVMGWTDSHLHQFKIGHKIYTENPECKEYGIEENSHKLIDLIKQQGRSFEYEYDFGDGWRHEITIEDNRHPVPVFLEEAAVNCIAGANACPPEDVGGMSGYNYFCEALHNPKHKEHKQYKGWITGVANGGADFDAAKFDIEKVNIELMKYLRWSRNRKSS